MFYLDLFSKLEAHKVDYLLIGGLAVSLHGIERATMDIDITVAMQPENLSHLIACAKDLGLKPVAPVPLESLGNIELLKQWHSEKNMQAFAMRTDALAGVTLDVLLFTALNFADMHQRAVHFDIGNISIPVASIDDLIALKQAAGRAIDMSDIAHLQRLKTLWKLDNQSTLALTLLTAPTKWVMSVYALLGRLPQRNGWSGWRSWRIF